MAFSRAATLRSCFRGARPTAARPQICRQIARRGYASGGHESAKAGGDTIWAVTATAVTLPTCWYLLQGGGSDSSHGHGEHGEEHAKSHGDGEEEKEDEPKDESDDKAEEKPDESEGKEDDKDSENPEDSSSEDESKDAESPDTSEDEGEGIKKNGNIVKKIPDAKGGSKKRLESDKGIKQGDIATTGGDGEPKDKASSSKPVGGKNSQSSKQEGLTNTDTKHSIDITNDPTKSKKGEGMPETAKAKGTVDPKRPQPNKE